MTTTSQTSADSDGVSLNSATMLAPLSPAPVLITEQEVLAITAAAAPATTHRRSPAIKLFAAVRHIHIRLPDARPVYPRVKDSYFEAARMSRLMDRL